MNHRFLSQDHKPSSKSCPSLLNHGIPFAILGWGAVHDSLECTGEVGMIMKTAFDGDGGDGCVGFLEHLGGGFGPDAGEELSGTGSEGLAKAAIELAFG